MKQFYLVFINGYEEPVPVNGVNHQIFNDVLSIFDEEENISALFLKDHWRGFVVDYVTPCEHDHSHDLPSINQPNTSGH